MEKGIQSSGGASPPRVRDAEVQVQVQVEAQASTPQAAPRSPPRRHGASTSLSGSPRSVRSLGSSVMRRNLLEQVYPQSASGSPERSPPRISEDISKIRLLSWLEDLQGPDGKIDAAEFREMISAYKPDPFLRRTHDEAGSGRRTRTVSTESTQTTAGQAFQRFTETAYPPRADSPFAVRTLTLQEGSVKKLLGEGGFGRTYLVRVNEPVEAGSASGTYAFKEIKSQQRLERLRHELQRSRLVEHVPRAMKVYGVYEIDGVQGILCEYIEGKRSDAFFQNARTALRRGEINAKQFFDLVKHAFSDLMTTLACLEQRRLMHNDISADNLIFSSDKKELVSIDFGLLKQYEERAQIGKANYMAPEITQEAAANAKLDPFYAGQVLHTWIYGQPFNWSGAQGTHDVIAASWRKVRGGEGQIRFDPNNIVTLGENQAHLYTGANAVPPVITDLLSGLLSGAPDQRLSAIAAITQSGEAGAEHPFFQRRIGRRTIETIVDKIANMAPQESETSASSLTTRTGSADG